MTSKEIEEFTNKLMDECRKDETYSVIEVVEKMGFNYEQVKEWAKTNKIVKLALEECRMYCANNAEKAGLDFKIPEEEAFKYMCENDDEFKAYHEKQQALEMRAEKERKGEEIIEKDSIMIKDKDTMQKETNIIKTDNKTDTMTKQWWDNREAAKEERIQQWREKQAKNFLGLTYKVKKQEGINITLDREFHEKGLTEDQQIELDKSIMCAATGSAGKNFSNMLLTLTASSFFRTNNDSDIANNSSAIMEALLALKPQDEIEGMLISRSLVLHNQYMHFMGRISSLNQTTAGIDMNLNRATKLMRLYNETIDTLSRYRRKGQQKITVQHVNVSKGGQAIIGDLKTTGGRGNAKN